MTRVRRWFLVLGALGGLGLLLPVFSRSGAVHSETPTVAAPQAGGNVSPAPGAPAESGRVTVQLEKARLTNGGTLSITGTAPPGKPVYLEIYAEKKVRANLFDNKRDKETGQIPYIFYMTDEMPGYYKIVVPRELKGKIEEIKKEGRKWSYSQALKDLGAENAFAAPAKIKIDKYKTSILASITGSRGELLPAMDEKENRKRAMQLVKSRFRGVGKVLTAGVETLPDGSFKAQVKLDAGLPDGNYRIVAVADKGLKSEPLVFENRIGFPTVYLANAGTSLNLFWPFLLTLAIAIFGVLMGAGGGFILNPLLVLIWPFPHNVVAGTVMPTVAFSQASGIYNYSKIKFINWKVGVVVGLSMLAGGFIGPKLTELITLDQFKFVFGWILLVLAALLIWQTTPGYLSKNKKEQAILKEFKKRAEAAAQGKKD
ncbi:MAG: sulfite exporter TauE/SafE family protein [Deltaproteobacteria bacterium]|nr:sulfite exporter TauE/SafE family protein [Deltaproteobacteria bacterium]